MPDQRSLIDQLTDLKILANSKRLYDAADYLDLVIQRATDTDGSSERGTGSPSPDLNPRSDRRS